MIIRFPIVVLALFAILGEAKSFRCYVCTNCSVVFEGKEDVEISDRCPACVIEDKFDYRKYLYTKRSCANCPESRWEMINNNRSFYHCCYKDLCEGLNRYGLQEINRTASIRAKQNPAPIIEPDKFRREKGLPKSPRVVNIQDTEPSADAASEHLEISPVATNPPGNSNPQSAVQHSDSDNTQIETTPAKSTTPAGAGRTTPESPEKRDDISVKSTTESKTKLPEGASSGTEHSSHLNPSISLPTLDTADKPSNFPTAKHTTVTGKEEGTPEPTNKRENTPLEKPAETTKQDMESSSPATCHTSVWYLAFFISIICGPVLVSSS